jgi:ankyrin repeat protein
LAELPDTLDETYERTLREITKADAELAHRIFQCVAVASRPLRVEELAEFLAFDFGARPIPKFREDWRPEYPLGAVLDTCPLLLSVINIDDSPIIQFSHYSVKEFLTSSRFADKCDSTSRRYHVSMTPAHTVVAQACLGILLHLDQNIAEHDLEKFPLAKYAAEHWFEHARVEGVSKNAEEGMKQLFDPKKPHLAVWLRIHDPILTHKQAENPLPPKGTALHYAAFCGFHNVVESLAIQYRHDVRSRGFYNMSTPLHLASRQGFVQVARVLVKCGARVSAKNKEGLTPLHLASARGHVEVMRLLVDNGARVSANSKDGQTPLHLALINGHLDLSRFLIEHNADVSAKDNDGWTPLRWAMSNGHLDLARILVEHDADVSAKDNDGRTLLHWAVERGHVDLTQFLVEHGADVSAKDNDERTPLRRAVDGGGLDLVQLLVDHGADVSTRDKQGRTLLRRAVERNRMDLARILVDGGADVSEPGITTGGPYCIGRWNRVAWISRGSSLSRAPTCRPRTRTGGPRCIGR